MNELINITYDSERPTVLGRELHDAMQVKTAYRDWFPRMCEYGFLEGVDFRSFLRESSGGRPAKDHQLTIAMAKEICMLHHAADEANTQFVPVSGYFHVVFLQFVPISHQIVVDGQLLKAKKCRKSRYVL